MESCNACVVLRCCQLSLSFCAQAKAFALLSEEGIAKGIRRIVALTADDAGAAIAEGDRLTTEATAAAALPDADLDKALVHLKASVDAAVIPAATKAAIRDQLAILGKRVADAAKAAAAANKQRAVAEAVAAADAAVAAGRSHVVTRVDVGIDAKALTEAWNAITGKHGDNLCALLVSVDDEKQKVLAYAGVPNNFVAKIKANEWVGAALAVVGGKGGGKPTAAQGQGQETGKADEALQVAEQFATMKL